MFAGAFMFADSAAMWSHPDLLEPVSKGHNNDIKKGDHKKLKSQTVRFMTIMTLLHDIYLVWPGIYLAWPSQTSHVQH